MKKLLAMTALSAALFFGQTAVAEEKAAEEVKPSRVEMVLVLDESGSMSDLTSDTIGGFNSMIEKEKQSGENVRVTTVLFSDRYKILHNHRDIKDVEKMTEKRKLQQWRWEKLEKKVNELMDWLPYRYYQTVFWMTI